MTLCRLEPDVIRAAASGEWTESLRAHAASCADCAAAAEVGPWMEEFARVDDREHILPDPAVLWLNKGYTANDAAATGSLTWRPSMNPEIVCSTNVTSYSLVRWISEESNKRA